MEPSTDGQPKPLGESFSHLRTETSSYRINQIEKIRSYGVGGFVDLPQLVVCGDQSAGKSSVLEGITGIPFPRQEGLCTRFPTEIILRHSEIEDTSITASIRPHISRTGEVKKDLSNYRKTVTDMAELPSIIHDVSKLMQIRGYSDDGQGYAFAPDALRIEVSGPIDLHLSVVDLPGLISVSNEEQTEEDVQAVHDMVAAYLESSRTIILTVLQASNDIANQPIIKLAREHDPQGIRTVGIITKPDLINAGSEAKIALIAKNQDNIKLKLGFFLLKNPSPSELKEGLTMDGRSKRELHFFTTGAWAKQNLDMERVGAEKLRSFLQRLLDTHIKGELPKVKKEIRDSLIIVEAELASLGSARPTVGHIRAFLTTLSMKLYELLQAALDGNYHSIDFAFFADTKESRLRALIQQENYNFAAYMRLYGEGIKRQNSTGQVKDGGEEPEPDYFESTPDQLIVSEEEMENWVRKIQCQTKGRELPGNTNSALLAELFHDQSRRWPSIAEAHIHRTLQIASRWVQGALKRIIPEETLRGRIYTILEDWLDNADKNALAELEKLVLDEKRSPMTYNHYYTDNIQKARLDDRKSAFDAAIDKVSDVDGYGNRRIALANGGREKLMGAVESRIVVDMDKQACKEAQTQLNAYYKVAMKTFVDNVTRQVIERHIVSPMPKAFSPSSVSELSDEALLEIGSEPEDQAERRKKLTTMVEGLKKSLRELQRPA